MAITRRDFAKVLGLGAVMGFFGGGNEAFAATDEHVLIDQGLTKEGVVVITTTHTGGLTETSEAWVFTSLENKQTYGPTESGSAAEGMGTHFNSMDKWWGPIDKRLITLDGVTLLDGDYQDWSVYNPVKTEGKPVVVVRVGS